jgi:FkbM family methyltransferase
MLSNCRASIAYALRFVPNFRGRGRLIWIINRVFLRLGAEPVVLTLVNDVKLRVDLRTLTEFNAFWGGNYDPVQIRLISSILNKLENPCFLDIGANIGFYSTCVAHSLGNKGIVYSFEPHPGNCNRLIENISNNKLSNVKILNIGLSSGSGSLNLVMRGDFSLGSDTGNCSIEISDSMDSKSKKIPIELHALDAIMISNDIDHVDVIKLDVEGHEDEVLKGAERTLSYSRPIIQLEVNRSYFDRKGVDFNLSIMQLLPPSYTIFSYDKLGIVRIPSLSACPDLVDVILCPDEKIYLIGDRICDVNN